MNGYMHHQCWHLIDLNFTWIDGEVLTAQIYMFMAFAAREAGLMASQAQKAKIQKYTLLNSSHHFILVAIETSCVFRPRVTSFIRELGHRIRAETGELHSLQFLLQNLQ